ncbi:mitochondrial 37S ribosomal protein bS1m [Aspergillus homomorphus CBS 101889]|uniref:Mitochondrial ribosomal protein MRP51 n=1 Tax=Aspergillus homomorphus (strain CBS 101889) TaxID=1450537 RepID=A0A395HVU5_ASPHC|nr:hypothetical protein BO97DRAFT_406026 [Aspergillus homomorphus CBS 101889]RAL11646.1 hypothetical protein BO97DRAFT_406026 [Aspergillus homomorphus CBS 101889]
MATTRLSPAASLLRNSRLFALPQALTIPQDVHASHESNTATAHHPTRAAIITPASSLARGDWGLKRPLPAKSTSAKSQRPIVRIKALDTFEHTTDFESASDHTVTLEKFQDLHLPMSLPAKINYSNNNKVKHVSPFETRLDNTERSAGLDDPAAKKFRHSGPYLADQTEAEFQAYLKTVRKSKPEIMQKLREHFVAQRTADRRKEAQDSGNHFEDLDKPIRYTEAEFKDYVKSLRASPKSLGPVVFEILDIPPPPAVPSDMMKSQYYHSPALRLSSEEYATAGPPKTHPSAGLTYTRTQALLYNHPKFGPQTYQRPVQARVLRPKGHFKGRKGKAYASIGGIVVDDINAMAFEESSHGISQFDATIPGGAKYWANPIRASVNIEGRIDLTSERATPNSRAPYGVQEYQKPNRFRLSPVVGQSGQQHVVPRLDRARPQFGTSSKSRDLGTPEGNTETIAQELMKKISS